MGSGSALVFDWPPDTLTSPMLVRRLSTFSTGLTLSTFSKTSLLIVLGIVLSAILTETLLQVGAAFMGASNRAVPPGFGNIQRRIVALGDSNTYGLHLEREQAYPMVLQKLWNASEEEKIEVLNMGFPGTNSSQVRKNIPLVLGELYPDAVLVMVGANDVWTAPVPFDDTSVEGSSLTRFLREHSRLYKLVYIVRRAFDNRKLEVVYHGEKSGEKASGTARFGSVEFELGHQKATPRRSVNLAAELTANLKAIAASCREAGADFYLLAYHTNNDAYGVMNPMIRRAAELSSAHLVDLYPTFRRACPDAQCKPLLFWDSHPNADGHELIARILLAELRKSWRPGD